MHRHRHHRGVFSAAFPPPSRTDPPSYEQKYFFLWFCAAQFFRLPAYLLRLAAQRLRGRPEAGPLRY